MNTITNILGIFIALGLIIFLGLPGFMLVIGFLVFWLIVSLIFKGLAKLGIKIRIL